MSASGCDTDSDIDLLVLSACSASKQREGSLDCHDLDRTSLNTLLEATPESTLAAHEMYTGAEHSRIKEGVEALRELAQVDWYILSAGAGLVEASTPIPPYECTFSKNAHSKADYQERAQNLGLDTAGLTINELIKEIGRAKGIPADVASLDLPAYDAVFVLLGEEYLLTIQPALQLLPPSATIFLFAPDSRPSDLGPVLQIPAGHGEREALDVAMARLKGSMFRNLAKSFDTAGRLGDSLADRDEIIQRALGNIASEQSDGQGVDDVSDKTNPSEPSTERSGRTSRTEPTRAEDLNRLYAILDELESAVNGPQRLADCDGYMDWPDRGLYVFFAEDERRAASDHRRITRIGTHAVYEGSSTSLWDRLRTHRGALSGTYEGGGNHRGSVFRKHVGEAMLHRDAMLDDFAAWGDGSSAARDRRLEELPHERRVSAYIRDLPFLWIAVDDPAGPESDRAYLERNMIALVSNFETPSIDPRADDWLGRQSPREEIQDSGLWNIDHVGESYDPGFLGQLEYWADETESL